MAYYRNLNGNLLELEETNKLSKRDVAELSKLLGHADQRVRQAAQFELVRRGDPIPLAQATLDSNPRLMRLHGIWGLAQLSHAKPDVSHMLMPLAQDKDSEVRAQWAKFIGETHDETVREMLFRLLQW